MSASRITAFVTACALARGAAAQDSAEPIDLSYRAPTGCPEAEAFFHEITARTIRVRLAKPGEAARTLHVIVARRGIVFAGKLWIEDIAARSRVREVIDTTCGEVVAALGLVAAMAVDPKASTSPLSTSETIPSPTAAPAAGSSRKGPESGLAATPAAIEVPPPARAVSLRYAAGAQAEVSTIAGAVFAVRVFGDLDVGNPRATWAPTFRLALGRSLDIEKRADIGGATFRFTQASLETCLFRVAIASSFGVRPCIGVSGGVLEAQGKDVTAARGRDRPWISTSAHARLEWKPLPLLSLEVDAGALAPLSRDWFFFDPNVPIYRAPALGFVARAGLAVRFP